MKAKDIKEAALQVLAKCTTCKQVSDMYKELVETYGKEDAAKIRTAAKEMVKARKDYYTDNANKVINATKDGQRVTNVIWKDILRDRSINKFAVIVYNSCGKSVENIINTYASYRTSSGIAACRHNSKTNGLYYTAFELSSSNTNQALCMLRTAIRNAKNAAIKGGIHTYKVVDVTD